MAYALLRYDPAGPWCQVNHKRVQRLWREEGLRRPVRTRKRRRVHPDTTERLRAERANQVWALDFQFDETADEQPTSGGSSCSTSSTSTPGKHWPCGSPATAPPMTSSPS
jgi:transposase InsO family protein